jgi:CcmD family protein
MGAFVAAYVIVWLAVAAYVARLGVRQRQLKDRVDALCAHVAPRATAEHTSAKAA